MTSKACHCGAVVTASTDLALNTAFDFHNLMAHGVALPVAAPVQSGNQPPLVTSLNISNLAVKFNNPIGATSMNGTMALNQKEQFYVDGFNADGSVGALAPGQTVAVSLDNPAIASLVADATPGIDPNGASPVQSIASGFAVAVAIGTANLIAVVTNSDGSVAAKISAVVTVTGTTVAGITTLTISFSAPVAQ